MPTFPQPTPTEAKGIRPDVLVVTLLDDIHLTLSNVRALASQMETTLKTMQSQMERVPKGVAETFDNIAVSSTSEAVFDTVKETEQPWFSATVYNEGPDSVQVRANDGDPSERAWIRQQRKTRYLTLDLGESMDVDFKSPKLQYIYYKLAAGGTSAVIKIVGEW